MTIHLNFYTSQQYVYDLLCFIIIVSTMYDKMMVFNFVTEIETNNILTQRMEMVNISHVLDAKSNKILL